MAREMKDSGIEWIGEIPADWNVAPIGYSTKWKSVKGCPDEQVLSLYREYGVIPKDSRDDNHNVTSLDTSGYKLVDKGDFVINKMKAWQGSMGLSDYRGIISPAYHVCEINNKNVHKKYFHYLLRNQSYLPEYERLSTGLRVGQWDLAYDDFKKIPFLIPPYNEQKRIVNEIEKKCSQIDTALEKTRNTIEEYKKFKQAIITKAVTKGIRGDRPMRDSGIEWIGEIPAEWEICKLKYLCHMQAGKNLTTEEISPSGAYPVYGGNGIRGYYSHYNFDNIGLLIGRQGALCGNVHIVNSKIWATEHAVITTPSKLANCNYLYYLTSAMNLNQYASNTAAQPGLSVGVIQNKETVFVNTLHEQQEIADYLDKKCAAIDTLIAKKEQIITDLESYKKSLIYEYVTGKKEVN